ncbi:MAG: LacI family DNA-binding transcriptional regulator [Anaerocolumna sp.]
MSTIKIKEIAKIAGVSPSTVSNALNGQKNIGKATREKILKLCEEKGYTPNLMGKNLKIGRTKTVVFNFSDFDRSFYLDIIKGISDNLFQNGYDLIICTNKSSKNFMNSSFTCGAICLDIKMTNNDIISFAEDNFPIIVMDRIIDHSCIKNVIVDNYPIMCQLVQKIIDKGFRRFGFIGGPTDTLDNQERFQALLDTLEENSIEFDHKNYYHGDFREKSGYQAAKIMLMSGSIPEVIVCSNDNMAIGAIRAFKENGFQIPADIAISGFDNAEKAELAGLTTVEIPRYESGFLAAKSLLEMIEGRAQQETYKIKANIVWRSTV